MPVPDRTASESLALPRHPPPPAKAAFPFLAVLAPLVGAAVLYAIVRSPIMLAFAAVMAAAMLYNAMSANISERLGEFSALHAQGMSASMLSRLIAAENLSLAVAAIPFGLVGGVLLAGGLLSTYHSLGYHLRLEMQTTTPAVVACAILLAAAFAQIPLVRRIYSIDLARIVRERTL